MHGRCLLWQHNYYVGVMDNSYWFVNNCKWITWAYITVLYYSIFLTKSSAHSFSLDNIFLKYITKFGLTWGKKKADVGCKN